MKFKRTVIVVILAIVITLAGTLFLSKFNYNLAKRIGEPIDSFNGVSVYYNGSFSNVSGRNITKSGYNLGLKYQCVEFVKRYYYEHLDHRMPNSYGHARDFFNRGLADGEKNTGRDLYQYSNPSASLPKVNDLVIFNATTLNKYGHVAIVSKVTDNEIEIIQQNAGSFYNSRETFNLGYKGGKWAIENKRIMGWLRKR